VFIPFSAWFLGTPLEAGDYPRMLFVGVISFFSSATIAIPFMLDFMHLPADMFHLFIAAGVYAARVGDMLDGMHLFVFAVIVACGVMGRLHVHPVRAAVLVASTLVLLLVMTLASRAYLGRALDGSYRMDEVLATMPPRFATDVESVVLEEADPLSRRGGASTLERIRRRGILRVGVTRDQVPLSFHNERGELTGLDVELAHMLAEDLGVSLELLLLDRTGFADRLDARHCDVITGVAATSDRALEMGLSAPYLDFTLALVVPDHRARDFRTLEAIARQDGLRAGLAADPAIIATLERKLAESLTFDIEPVPAIRDYFEGRSDVDALILSAEKGSAWTLLYPAFDVETPWQPAPRVPVTFAVSRDSKERGDFVDHWITQHEREGKIAALYDYWILGLGADDPDGRRWCIARDVLGWID
jgi:ABC-type amino acid transport substrate-binding protein